MNHPPKGDPLQRVAEALGVPVSTFFGSTDQPPLDLETRHRLESALHELHALMPTLTKRELRQRIMSMIGILSESEQQRA